MLGEDQQRVAERLRTEPRRELERTLPVLARDELFHRARQALVQLFELRVPRSPGLLRRRHDRPPPRGADGMRR